MLFEKKLLRIFLVFLFSASMYSQQSDDAQLEKSNPIIYFEMFGGSSLMNHAGLSGGLELNYQYKKNLFTFRYTNVVGYISNDVNPYFPIPTYYKSEDDLEYALLYGQRWMTDRHSFSVSAGISCNNLDRSRRYYLDEEEEYHYNYSYETFFGVPFEANYKWFYPKKRSNLIFNAMIPSVGIKFLGNISKNSYVGVGLTIGFGLPKQY